MKSFKIFDEIHFSGFPCSSMQRTSRQTSKRQDLLWPSLSCRFVIIIISSSSSSPSLSSASASGSDEKPPFIKMLYPFPHHNINLHNICLFILARKEQRVNVQKLNNFWQSFSVERRKMVRLKIETILHSPSDEILRWTIWATVELRD